MKISVKVKPNARTEKVTEENGTLLIKTREPAREGKANEAVIRLSALYYKVPRSAIRIVSGLNGRNKIIEIVSR
jgi:uncharacterized protein YggU (UPF0235/DUF167 family)